MPVSNTHPQYDERIDEWKKLRAVIEGEKEVKKAGETYLPMLVKQSQSDYDSYRQRAQFYNATSRTVRGLAGAIMRKPPNIDWYEADISRLDDIGRAQESVGQLMNVGADEVVGIGRVGFLVDAYEDGSPFIATYRAESITNWKFDVINGKRLPIMIVLREKRRTAKEDDPFVEDEEVIYRVLNLGISSEFKNGVETQPTAKEAEKPFYYQEVWSRPKSAQQDDAEWVMESRKIVRGIGGRVFREIPFVPINSSKLGMGTEKSAVLDLADVNLSHYRNSADLEHGLHLTALPTPWATGIPDDGEQEFRIGSATAWVTSEDKAAFGFLEFTGAGLGSLSDQMDKKEKQMAVLGARLLESAPAGVEAAETVKMRHAGEQSALATISDTVAEAFTKLLRFVAAFTSADQRNIAECSVELSKDFEQIGLAAQEMMALMQMAQSGLISWNTFFWNLQRGEVIPDGVTSEEEIDLIAEGLPSQAGTATIPQPPQLPIPPTSPQPSQLPQPQPQPATV